MADIDPKRWPNTLYRYAGGQREGMTFARPQDVPEGEGWVEYDDLGPPPEAAPEPAPESPSIADKRFAQVVSEKERLLDTVKLYEDFLTRVRDDAGCPPSLKEAIEVIMGGEAKPKPKSRKKRSAS